MNDACNACGAHPRILAYGAPRRFPIGGPGLNMLDCPMQMHPQTLTQSIQARIQPDIRVRKAFSRPMRSIADASMGDRAIYNVKEKEWHGPGIAIKVEGSAARVSHGNKIFKFGKIRPNCQI